MEEKLKNKKILIKISGLVLLVVLIGLALWVLVGRNDTEDGILEYLTKSVYTSKQKDLGTPNDDVGVVIFDCDSTEDFKMTEFLKVVNKSGKYVQGTGAFANMKFQTDLMRGVLKTPVDISAYEKGSVHISLYVGDITCLSDGITLELTSMGNCDADELQWAIPISKLENGWNEFYLSIPDATITGMPELSAINYFRVYSVDPKMGVTVILDDVYASETEGVVFAPDSSDLKPVEPDEWKETAAKNGKMIMSCNTVNIFKALGNVKVTTTKGEYVEGTGAFKTEGFQESLGQGIFAKPVDISDYAKGYVHLSLYVNDTSLLSDALNFELSSSATCDKDEYQWVISKASLSNGWNEIWLPFSEANVTGKPNLKAIDYFRIFTLNQKQGLVTIFDNVYATMDGASDAYKETESPYGKMIMSCNTVNIFSTLSDMKVTTEKNEYVEGTGALKTAGAEENLGKGVLKKAVDISAYKDGQVHISLYVNDVSKIKESINFELSSSGAFDADEYEWPIGKEKLKNGWNDLYLSFADANQTGSPNLKAINFFRLYTVGRNAELVTILDNVYAGQNTGSGAVETESKYGKMIVSGNTTSNFRAFANMAVTSEGREYVEGTGALKAVGTTESLGEAVLINPVNIAAYANGYIHLSVYVNKVSFLTNTVNFELSSAGACDVDEYEWFIAASELENGWNEIYLPFKDAQKTGTPNLSAINYFRMFTVGRNAKLVTILDDVYATNNTNGGDRTACGERLYVGDILMADCTCYFSDSFNMKLSKNCKQGSYALKAKNPAVGIYGTFNTAVDISNFKEGYVHVWLYINEKDYLTTNVNFELSSSGTCNVNEYEWVISKENLSSGWNELWLAVENAHVTGTPDLASINYFRMFTTTPNSELEMMIDDVYATSTKK